MASLSQTDRANPQADLGTLQDSRLAGVLAGAGSLILRRSDGASVVVDASADENGRTGFGFDAGGGLRLLPDASGLEVYVVNTAGGVFPVH